MTIPHLVLRGGFVYVACKLLFLYAVLRLEKNVNELLEVFYGRTIDQYGIRIINMGTI